MIMAKSNDIKLSDAISNFIKDYNLEPKLNSVAVVNSLYDIIGEENAKYIQSARLSNGKLFLKINSSVYRQEILFNKTECVNKINEHLGKIVVYDIIAS